ncbi:unnamed protein product [Oikopleura dioica]|uniref:Uncharacterized protein n=1 Tax=Oikopleura dioica TaxID=34765 RepID=E4YGE4_OIKDI|nr:unnamed protein product [Oikopleura dioica]
MRESEEYHSYPSQENVVKQQPEQRKPKINPYAQKVILGQWQAELTGCKPCCGHRPLNCCLHCWFPCFGVADVAEKYGHGWFMSFAIGWASAFSPCATCFICCLRTEVREKHGILGGCFYDFCAACWCQPCVISQMQTQAKLNEQ